ncbi:F510_1955 family glycosylhydrolase [Rhodococcus xishaensis]|uniref:Exo-alpha-sialidase n=1 Tax=Rhodococcus xishaensis TaxID=2487364 RepID=A0A3S3BLM9_9NOCA|nr:sialidase family protein [Rhodococcus xishaensis]RVW04264.1 exo-alpha-sialidase [Rhodococcus xishaensis]
MPRTRVPRTRVPRTRVTVSVLSAAALLLVGCSEAGQPTTQEHATAPAVALDTALTHVHGIHVRADGTVLAGTHTGLYALDSSGGTSRVGDSDDDFMGLTGVPGTDTLFSSGHPGVSSNAPNPLGLRGSDDGGTTWSDRSLGGQVDFHTLAADGRLLVGFDGADELAVSVDAGYSWTRGASVDAYSLAMTTAAVWASTPDGLLRSTDGAQSFTAAVDSPPLVLLAGAGDALWGIDGSGDAWRSREGADWQRVDRVGAVDALTAVDYETAYAATNQALYILG